MQMHQINMWCKRVKSRVVLKALAWATERMKLPLTKIGKPVGGTRLRQKITSSIWTLSLGSLLGIQLFAWATEPTSGIESGMEICGESTAYGWYWSLVDWISHPGSEGRWRRAQAQVKREPATQWLERSGGINRGKRGAASEEGLLRAFTIL